MVRRRGLHSALEPVLEKSTVQRKKNGFALGDVRIWAVRLGGHEIVPVLFDKASQRFQPSTIKACRRTSTINKRVCDFGSACKNSPKPGVRIE